MTQSQLVSAAVRAAPDTFIPRRKFLTPGGLPTHPPPHVLHSLHVDYDPFHTPELGGGGIFYLEKVTYPVTPSLRSLRYFFI